MSTHPNAPDGDSLHTHARSSVGPTQAKTYYFDDLVVCLLRGGFTRVEQTLLEGGRSAAVIQQRMQFQEVMRPRFKSVIEDATGRRVVGFMSGNQQDPDTRDKLRGRSQNE